MEYLLLSGITLGGLLTIIGVMYGAFKWAMITKITLIVMPLVLVIVFLGYWIGTQGVTLVTIAVGCAVGVSSVVTVFQIVNRILFKPFARQSLYIEEEGNYLAGQVAEISAVMSAVANEGDLRRVLQAERDDDVGKLVNSVNTMVGSLREHAVVSETIAGGDLTVRVQPKSERDVLGNAFAKMVGGLNSTVGRVSQNAEELDVASRQLAETAKQAGNATGQVAGASQEIAKGASDQARHAQDTAKSVEQLSGIIAEIAKGAEAQASGVTKASSSIGEVSEAIDRLSSNANAAAEGSLKAAEAAGDGVSVTKETVDGMKEIMSTVEVVSDKVMELGQRSTEIGKIVGVIEEIAAQTNLLALNAAIEAARAGEQGRGFAVVSDEVRKLAERTASATKEIAELIGNVQNGVAAAVRAMEEGTGQVQEGYRLASEAGEALEEILRASNAVSEQIEQISTRAAQVSESTNELVRIIDSVSAVTEENSAATGEMSASAAHVSRSVDVVTGVIEENTAAAEEVSASAEEMNAEVEEIVASSEMLQGMADRLQGLVLRFSLESMERERLDRTRESMDDGGVLGPELEMCMASPSGMASGGKRTGEIRKDSILRKKGK